MDVLLAGPTFKPGAARDRSLMDELVSSPATSWCRGEGLDHAANPEASANPWDRPGSGFPAAPPRTPPAAFLPPPGLLRKQTKGAVYPAPRAIMSAAVEGAQVDFDTASRIESRYLTSLVVNQNSKNMIQAFFFDLQAIGSGSLRPAGVPPYRAVKVGVLGAGMMGVGIAYSVPRAGMQVVLKDVSEENAAAGRAYSERLARHRSPAAAAPRSRGPRSSPGSPPPATPPPWPAATW